MSIWQKIRVGYQLTWEPLFFLCHLLLSYQKNIVVVVDGVGASSHMDIMEYFSFITTS